MNTKILGNFFSPSFSKKELNSNKIILPENGRLIKNPITVAATMKNYFTNNTRTIGQKGPQSNHETIVLRRITCKEISC